MTGFDWIIVAFWVIGTSGLGVYYRKYVETTGDYLLAGRKLRWWQIGVAQAADAVDATDFVAVTGQGYRIGFTQLGYAWWGMGLGTIVLSRYIAPLLYRTGVYTNAEYLELRFSTSLRVISAAVQVLYRFVAMALVVYAMATMFNVIIGLDMWYGIWAAMLLTLAYVFTSGQLGVVMAAIPQMALMLLLSLTILVAALREVGGWSSFVNNSAGFENLFHLAGYSEPGISGGIYLWGMILTMFTYPIVNQTVAQRIVGARSGIDARKGTMASLVPWYVITGGSIIAGMAGLLLFPGLTGQSADMLFPHYMKRFLPEGALGLGVAALVLASTSTGAGIGTAIAGLATVDIYKRFISSTKSDKEYLFLTRIFAAGSIIFGTFFAMLIPRFGGMIPFYVAFTGTFFLPLTVPYIGGALVKRASRHSGLAAVLGGVILGSILFIGNESFPVILGHPQWRPFWVFGFSWFCFFVWTYYENGRYGPIPETELASKLNLHDIGKTGTPEEIRKRIEAIPCAEWDGKKNIEFDRLGIRAGLQWYRHPAFYEVFTFIILIILMIAWW